MPFTPADLTTITGREPVSTEPVVQKPKRKGFAARVFEDIKKRSETFSKGLEREQATASDVLQFGGAVAGGLFDVAGEALVTGARITAAVTPEFIERPVRGFAKDTLKSVLGTSTGQAGLRALNEGLERWEEFKEESPEAAANIESVINIGSLFPAARVTTGAARVGARAGKVIEKGAEAAIETGKRKFVGDLLRPSPTKKVLEAEVPRTREVGFGPLKRSIVEPTRPEARAIEEVAKIAEIDAKKTAQQNFNVVKKTNIDEAEGLKKALAEKDVVFPRKELKAELERAKQRLSESPVIVGDAEKIADKLIAEIERRIEAAPSKGSSLLQVRKDFDDWVRSQKGAGIFDPAKDNAFTVANSEIRRTLNDFLDFKATDVGVKDSLAKQRNLFKAEEILIPKAAIERNTAFGRFLQNIGEVLGIKSRVVQGIAAAVGIGGLGAAATFAPSVAAIGGTGLLLFKAGKLALNPKLRKPLGAALKQLDRIAPTLDPAKKRLLDETSSVILLMLRELGEELPKGKETEEER